MTDRNELERLLAEFRNAPTIGVAVSGAISLGEHLANNAQHYLSLMDEVERLREALDEDVLEEAISDTLDLDWQPRWAAKEIRRRAALGETHDN